MQANRAVAGHSKNTRVIARDPLLGSLAMHLVRRNLAVSVSVVLGSSSLLRLFSLDLADGVNEPRKSVLETCNRYVFEVLTFSVHGRASLDLPRAVLNVGELERLEHLAGLQSQLEILLVGEHKERDVEQLLLDEELLELVIALTDSLLISRVDDEDDAVGAVIVVLPVGSDGLLSSDVPHVQLKAVLGL